MDLKSRSRAFKVLMNGSSDVIAKMDFNFITRNAIKIANTFLCTILSTKKLLLSEGFCGYGVVLDKYHQGLILFCARSITLYASRVDEGLFSEIDHTSTGCLRPNHVV